MPRTQTIPCLFLIFIGSLDCLTTVIGTLYYGTVELNPLIAGLVSTNLPAFVIIKLTVTVCAGLIFVLVDKTILESADKDYKSFKAADKTLKMAYIGMILFLYNCRKQHFCPYQSFMIKSFAG